MALFDDLTVLLKYRNDARNAQEIAKARGQMDRAKAGIGGFTKSAIASAAAATGISLGIGIAGRAIFKFGQESVDVFKRIQTGMSTIEGLVGISNEQLQAWAPEMQAIRRETGRTMGELTSGLYDVTSAGLRGDVAMDTLRISAMASAAGMGETRVVADLLTSAINAWGPAALSASQAGDDLAKAVELGKLPADALAGSMGQLIPIASAMGLEFGEAAGLMAAMSRTGTTAETATVQLGQVLSLLLKPGKEARETLAAFGFEADELRDRVADEGLLPVLQDLKDAFGEDEEAIARVFPNIRALRGVFDLLGPNLAANVAIVEDMANSHGKLGEAFHEVTDDIEFAEAQFQASSENMMASIGELIAPETVRGLQAIAGVYDEIAEAVRRASAVRQMFRDATTLRERVAGGDFTGPLEMFAGLGEDARERLFDDIQRRVIDEQVSQLTAAAQISVEREQERLDAGQITEAQFLARIDRMAAEAGGVGPFAAALEGAAEVRPELAAQLATTGRAAVGLDPTEMAQAISVAFPEVPRAAMTPDDLMMGAARAQTTEAVRAGMGEEAATQFDAATLSFQAAGEGPQYPRRPPTGLDEEFLRDALVFARQNPEQEWRAQQDLLEFAATNPQEAATVLMEAELPARTFDRMLGSLGAVSPREEFQAGVEAANVPELQKQGALDREFPEAPARQILGVEERIEEVVTVGGVGPLPEGVREPSAEPAAPGETSPVAAPESAVTPPEPPAGTATPPEPAEAPTGVPAGFSTATVSELTGAAAATADAAPAAEPLGPPEPPAAAAEEPEQRGLLGRAVEAVGGAIGGLFGRRRGEAPDAAPEASLSPVAMVEVPSATEDAAGLEPLEMAVEGPEAPPAPPAPAGDTINEGASTATTNNFTVGDIIINGATDPQATAVAVREELSKEAQAAVRSADPGVRR